VAISTASAPTSSSVPTTTTRPWVRLSVWTFLYFNTHMYQISLTLVLALHIDFFFLYFSVLFLSSYSQYDYVLMPNSSFIKFVVFFIWLIISRFNFITVFFRRQHQQSQQQQCCDDCQGGGDVGEQIGICDAVRSRKRKQRSLQRGRRPGQRNKRISTLNI
jgi:hypothetical protein